MWESTKENLWPETSGWDNNPSEISGENKPSSPENKKKFFNKNPNKQQNYNSKKKDFSFANSENLNNNEKIILPKTKNFLVSFEIFQEIQKDKSLSKCEIQKHYNDYKQKLERETSRLFFIENKNETWFKDKYGLERKMALNSQQKTQCQLQSNYFEECLKAGKFNNLNLTLKADKEIEANFTENKELESFNKIKILEKHFNYNSNTTKHNFKIELNKEEIKGAKDFLLKALKENNNASASTSDSIELSQGPFFSFDPDSNTVYLNAIPKSISKVDLFEAVKASPGFLGLSVSEPISSNNFNRYGWISFDSEISLANFTKENEENVILVQDVQIPVKKSLANANVIRIINATPAFYEERLEEDLNNTEKLVDLFNKLRILKPIDLFKPEASDPNQNSDEAKQKKLDLNILYLRKVHGFCYYCCEEYNDERTLANKCDWVHLRNSNLIGKRSNELIANTDEKSKEALWDEKLTSLINKKIENLQLRIENSIIVEDYNRNEEFNEKLNAFLSEEVNEVSTEKFQCRLCNKYFLSNSFTSKHLINRHFDNFMEKRIAAELKESIMLGTYLSDRAKITKKLEIIFSFDEYLDAIKFEEKNSNSKEDFVPRNSFRFMNRGKKSTTSNSDYKDFDSPNNFTKDASYFEKIGISYDDL